MKNIFLTHDFSGNHNCTSFKPVTWPKGNVNLAITSNLGLICNPVNHFAIPFIYLLFSVFYALIILSMLSIYIFNIKCSSQNYKFD